MNNLEDKKIDLIKDNLEKIIYFFIDQNKKKKNFLEKKINDIDIKINNIKNILSKEK